MSDENDWNHRTQFDGPRDPKVRSVSGAVNTRRAGPLETPHPEELREERAAGDEDEEPTSADDYDDPYADKWQKQFSHLPGVEPTGDQ